MVLVRQIVVILALSRLVRWLFAAFKLKQPPVIGEMVAGLALGPSGMGWLWPAASASLFPAGSLGDLNTLSQLGLLLFMFTVGSRLNASSLRAARTRAAVTSAASILAPFALGALVGVSVHSRLAPQGVRVVPFSLFLGTALSITAFPVLARILLDHGPFVGREVGVIAITCAAFDDVTGWLLLGVTTALLRADDPGTLVRHLMLLAGYFATMILLARPLLGRLASRNADQGGADDFLTALVVMLLSAFATEWLGIHGLFGAFFAGLMVPRGGRLSRVIVDRVEPLTLTLLLPLFFASAGLRTTLTLIDSAGLWGYAGLFLVVAVAGKGAASMLAARVMGMTWRDAAVLGVLLNTRGLIELVVLSVGLDLGVLSPVVFSMLVLMTLITTFATAPILTVLARTARTPIIEVERDATSSAW